MVAMVTAVVVALAVAVALVSGGGEVVVLVVLLAAVVVEHRASGEASWKSVGGASWLRLLAANMVIERRFVAPGSNF